MNRIVGLETEYGCLTKHASGPPGLVGRVRNWIFKENRYGLADIQQRDWDEPAGNGGFLFNGGRAYVDMGHLEYCTPECLDLKDLLLYDRAGDALLHRALTSMHEQNGSSFIRNNVDHYSGATFGCHENYLVRRGCPLNEQNVFSLLAFLTLRILYTGTGRVGATPGAELRGDLRDPEADDYFQISQRADFINNDLFEWVQFNRAIINTRDEPLADAKKYRRLHLLHGDTNVLTESCLLKVGTTSLVLDLLESNLLPNVRLADAVQTFRCLSHLPNGCWIVSLDDFSQEDAVDLLRLYCDASRKAFQGRDEETNRVLDLWDQTLRDLQEEPIRLVGKVDWITKRWLLRQFVEQEGIPWTHPWIKSNDLEYHNADPDRNLAWLTDSLPAPWKCEPEEVERSMTQPPQNTRALARSRIMHSLKNQTTRYFVDWEVVDIEGIHSIKMMDPFEHRMNPSLLSGG